MNLTLTLNAATAATPHPTPPHSTIRTHPTPHAPHSTAHAPALLHAVHLGKHLEQVPHRGRLRRVAMVKLEALAQVLDAPGLARACRAGASKHVQGQRVRVWRRFCH